MLYPVELRGRVALGSPHVTRFASKFARSNQMRGLVCAIVESIFLLLPQIHDQTVADYEIPKTIDFTKLLKVAIMHGQEYRVFFLLLYPFRKLGQSSTGDRFAVDRLKIHGAIRVVYAINYRSIREFLQALDARWHLQQKRLSFGGKKLDEKEHEKRTCKHTRLSGSAKKNIKPYGRHNSRAQHDNEHHSPGAAPEFERGE